MDGSGTDGYLNGTLLQRNTQAGNKLLIDLDVCFHRAQQRHGVMNQAALVIQDKGRILLAVRANPRFCQELRKCIAEASVIKHDFDDLWEAAMGHTHFLRQRVKALSMVGTDVDKTFSVGAILVL